MLDLTLIGVVIFGGLWAYLLYVIKPYLVAYFNRLRGRLPWGPVAYPLIGSLGVDEAEPWVQISAWTEKYGKEGIFTYFLGPQLQVVICDVDLARTLYKDPRLDGRPDTNLNRLFRGNGVAFAEVEVWKDIRKFEIMALKDFGRGSGSKNLLEEYVQQAASDLVADIQDVAANGQFITRPLTLKCIANCIASTLCGAALRSDDPRFARLTENINIVLTEGTTPNSPLNVFPWLAIFPPFRQQQARVEQRMNETLAMMREVTAQHHADFDPENVRDFMDAYLKEQSRRAAQGDLKPFTDAQLDYMSVEFYFAGLDATLATLQWIILLLSSHPDAQERCQEEVDSVIGRNKMATYADHHLMPYCLAIMSEAGRLGAVDPFGLPHRCLEDTPVLSYVIPKDATVIINYFGIHMSEELWGDPMSFRPERFLDEEGKFQANSNNLPFATGRRMCSGDNFAKMMVFISFVSLFQHFTVTRCDKTPWTEVKRINGVSKLMGYFSLNESK